MIEMLLPISLIIVSFVISMQLLDHLPFFKVRSLTEKEKRELEKGALIHFASYAAKVKILEKQELKASWRVTNFSNSFKKTIFFFFGNISERAKWFNYDSQYQCKIIIKKIPAEIVDKLLIRKYDNVVLLRDDLNLSAVEYEIEDNIYQEEKQANNKLKQIKYSMLPVLCLLGIMVVCFLILLETLIFVIVILN